MLNNISIRESSFNKDKQEKEKTAGTEHQLKYFGPGSYQLTKKDISYIVYGACFLASGGGGPIGSSLAFYGQND